MAAQKTRRQATYRCPACRKEFLSYQTTAIHCPHCGKPVRAAARRRFLRLAAFAILAALAAVAAAIWWLKFSGR